MVSPSFTRRGGAFGAQKNGLKPLRLGKKDGFGLHILITKSIKNPSTIGSDIFVSKWDMSH